MQGKQKKIGVTDHVMIKVKTKGDNNNNNNNKNKWKFAVGILLFWVSFVKISEGGFGIIIYYG